MGMHIYNFLLFEGKSLNGITEKRANIIVAYETEFSGKKLFDYNKPILNPRLYLKVTGLF